MIYRPRNGIPVMKESSVAWDSSSLTTTALDYKKIFAKSFCVAFGSQFALLMVIALWSFKFALLMVTCSLASSKRVDGLHFNVPQTSFVSKWVFKLIDLLTYNVLIHIRHEMTWHIMSGNMSKCNQGCSCIALHT